MASSSNSHDIFLSFRGLDTRKKFTDHLYEALKREGFRTFRDNDEIPKGKFIRPELRKAIMNSRISVIVLSKNYAHSAACLFELQMILDHQKTSDHFVLPVFYEVEPQEIKEQARDLNFEENEVAIEEMKGWNAALKEVVNMAGMVSQNQSGGYEAKFIEEIIGQLKSKLNGAQPRVADCLDGSSPDIQGNTPGTGGSSWFGRFFSQLFQKTLELVLRSRPDRQAKLGEANKFYNDEKLKRWVEEGAKNPSEEATLPPPPSNAAFQNRMPDNTPKDERKVDNSQCNGGSHHESQSPLEINLTNQRIPCSSDQLSACGCMGIRAGNYMFLHQISDRTIRWKIKVGVIRITGPSPSKDGQSTYKRFQLQDEEGDTIQATLFQSDFERFSDTLELHKTYFLSRAVLTKIDPQFATSNGHDCQMIIKSYTYVKRVEDSVTNPPKQEFNFLPLSTLSQLSSPPPQIDIVGIVVGVTHKEKRKRKRDSMDFSIRKIMLTDDTRNIAKVTTLGAFIDNECETLSNHLQDKPVVVITNVKLQEIHGCMTISTTQSSVILINPGMPKARQLESWKIENVEYLLNTWTDNESSSKIRTATIKEISESPNTEKDYYVKAFVASILPQEKCWYMSCNICHKKTDEPISTIFTCKNCQRKNVTAEPWCRVRVELGDATGDLPATLFGRHAEKVLACEAKALINLDIEEQLDLMEKWSTERTTTEFAFHVKAQQRNSLRLDVMSVDDV